MSYELDAVIAPRVVFASVELPAGVWPARLRDGFGLLPMTDHLARLLADPLGVLGFGGFGRLPAGGEHTLCDWSAYGPVAYVEASYYADFGEQRAALWAGGELLLPPLQHDGDGTIPTRADSPINRALAVLGVPRRWHPDELTAAGLRACRHTEDWLDAPPL